MEELIIQYAGGNPGATMFLIQLLQDENPTRIAIVFSKLKDCPEIRGTNVYILYADLCNKDLEKVAKLCDSCPNDILTDACSRQDRSGKALVAEYL